MKKVCEIILLCVFLWQLQACTTVMSRDPLPDGQANALSKFPKMMEGVFVDEAELASPDSTSLGTQYVVLSLSNNRRVLTLYGYKQFDQEALDKAGAMGYQLNGNVLTRNQDGQTKTYKVEQRGNAYVYNQDTTLLIDLEKGVADFLNEDMASSEQPTKVQLNTYNDYYVLNLENQDENGFAPGWLNVFISETEKGILIELFDGSYFKKNVEALERIAPVEVLDNDDIVMDLNKENVGEVLAMANAKEPLLTLTRISKPQEDDDEGGMSFALWVAVFTGVGIAIFSGVRAKNKNQQNQS